MKKQSFFSVRIKPVLVMAVMTIVCIALVSGIHLSTQELVIANEGLVLKKAVLYAAGVEIPGSNAEINSLYDERVIEKDGLFLVYDSKVSAEASNNGAGAGGLEAAAFITTGPGLWGEIQVVTAFDSGFEAFTGIEFIKQNETPGLGARITEEWFKEQLRGKVPPLSMVPEGSESSADNEIDAITGATRTSGYVLQLFNQAGARAADISKEGI